MKAMTTAAVVICPDLPATGLYQHMHNPEVPLLLSDILDQPSISGGDNIDRIVSESLIVDAIRTVHSSSVDTLFPRKLTPFKMPKIQCVEVRKTEYYQLAVIHEDEGSIQGTYAVHNRLFLEQLGLQSREDPSTTTDPDDFTERLFLVHGDQLTSHHIRSVKAEQSHALKSYDRRDWMLGVPAWFHIQMALSNTIVRTHYGPANPSQEAHHCLESDITRWGRSRGTRENAKYHVFAPLVSQSFSARILALFYTTVKQRGYMPQTQHDNMEQPTGIDEAIKSLQPDQFAELVSDVRETGCALLAWGGSTHQDPEFTTMCRMLQEIELSLSVLHAVKAGDIGLLRRLIDPLLIYFLGASQWNYAHEMLFYRWNTTAVNMPELQHAILASGIVNWKGSPMSHKPIDLGLEHLNGSCRIEMQCYKNSTHDTDLIFDRVCLTNT